MKYILLLIAILPLFVYGQKQGQARMDSLINTLPAATEDTHKVLLLQNIAFEYRSIDPDKGIEYALQGLALAEKLGWEKGKAKNYNALGNNHKAKSEYPKALEYYHKALKIFEETHNKKDAGVILMNIGTVYRPMQNYEKAIEYYQRALVLAEETGNKKTIGQLYGNMGVVYFEQRDFKKALEYNFNALKIFEEINDVSNIAWQLSNIGDGYAEQKDYNKSLEFHQKALVMEERLGRKSYAAVIRENIGTTYYNLAKNEKNLAVRQKYITHAIEHFHKAIIILTALNDLDYLKNVYAHLSETQELAGSYKEALSNYKAYTSLKDSIFSTDNRVKIADLSTERAEIEKKQQVEITRLVELKRRNETIFFTCGLILLTIFTGFVIKERRKSERLLLNILPEEVAIELKQKGNIKAKHFDDVTVLLTDFVNFTNASEKMSPEELVNELHSCFKEFDQIINKHNVEKIKTVGDAYLAVSGLPVSDPNHARNILKAAVEINNFMDQRLMQMGDATFKVRIGVNSGSVVAGIVGVKKFAYDIWGDTVNTAARMEQNSEAGKINISQTTYDLVKNEFKCTYRGDLDAKNKGKLAMYFVD